MQFTNGREHGIPLTENLLPSRSLSLTVVMSCKRLDKAADENWWQKRIVKVDHRHIVSMDTNKEEKEGHRLLMVAMGEPIQ